MKKATAAIEFAIGYGVTSNLYCNYSADNIFRHASPLHGSSGQPGYYLV